MRAALPYREGGGGPVPGPGLWARDLRVRGLGPFTLGVEPGACLGLSGPSGAGKSLILRALADLEPHEGRVWLDGQAQEEVPPARWRSLVGLLPAESAWWEDRVGDHFPDRDRAVELAGRLGFGPEAMDWEVARLSTGERQRLALARLLARGPWALLLDEPTSGLDPDNAALVERLVEELRTARDLPVIWVSHDRDQLGRVADRSFSLEEA